jgi:hypothetical protein
MGRPSSATGMLKEDEAVPRRHERREIFVGATHGSPFIRRRHAERGRGMPRRHERREIFVGATRGSPFIRRRHAERGRGMPRPYEEERTPDALILRVGFSGR